MTKDSAVRAHSTAGIEQATGIDWTDWVKTLDDAGAESLNHTEIAALCHQKMPEHVSNSGWWAQGIAIAYEHQKGLRVPGQTSDGTFSASASKTFPVDKDRALARWMAIVADRDAFGEVPLVEEPTTSSTEKWRYWRVKLADGTQVSLTISDKPGGKSTAAVQHSKLGAAEQISGWKQVWKDLLNQL